MALKGNLSDFSFTQLLNLVNVAQKTGTLIIERPQEQLYISFREGKLSYARNGSGPVGLTTVLYHAKKLNAAQVRAINERSVGISDKELGLLLINSNYMSQQDIISSLQAYYLNMVNRLFTWTEGLFRFDAELMPPKDKITVRISLENLIIEGTRRMREWEQLLGEIPSLEMSLKFSARPGINLRNLSLSMEEWKVISYVNPKNTIHQIARATSKNDLEIRRIVYSFLQAGLVEMIRPQGIPVQPPPQPFPSIQTVQPYPQAQVAQPYQPAHLFRTYPTGQPAQTGSPDQPIQVAQPVTTAQPVEPTRPRIAIPQASKAEFTSLINRIIDRIRSI